MNYVNLKVKDVKVLHINHISFTQVTGGISEYMYMYFECDVAKPISRRFDQNICYVYASQPVTILGHISFLFSCRYTQYAFLFYRSILTMLARQCIEKIGGSNIARLQK